MATVSQIYLNGTYYEIKDAVARQTAAGGIKYQIFDELPTAASTYSNIIALVANEGAQAGSYIEYFCVNTTGSTWVWEQVGATNLDIQTATGTVTIGNASAHRHTLPNIVGASYTPAGSISVTNTKTALTDITQSAQNATVTQAATDADVTGATYTPAGTVGVTLASEAITNIGYSDSSATVTNTKTAADVTGASYTPAGTITGGSHTHNNTLASASTGGVVYAYGAATADRVSSLTSSTYNNVAYNVSYASETLYFDTTTVKGINAISNGTTVTGLSTSHIVITNAASTPAMTFSGTAATIKPAVSYSKVTAVKYSKMNAAKYSKATGGTFTGTEATITPAVTYSKVSSVSYSKFSTASYSKVTAGSFTGTAATITPTYSTAYGTTSTSTAIGGAASGTYNVAGGKVVVQS